MSTEKSNPIQPINIRRMFLEKNPKIAKALPGFVYRYLDHILHIREVNEVISMYGHQSGIEFSDSVVQYFNVSQTLRGIENIPDKGRFIFASNHPLGGFDAMLLMSQVYSRLGELKFLVNDVLMNIIPLRELFVPLTKHGVNSRDVARRLEDEYKSDKQILIFPSGYASRKIKGVIQDLEWRKHFVVKAIEHRRDIIPVHVSGCNSRFFYNLANGRRRLGIPWNLEMFFLADETFRHRNQQFTITFGKPIPWQRLNKSKSQNEWAAEIRQLVYRLPESAEAEL